MNFSIGENTLRIRKRLRLSQAEVARRAGIRRATVADIELGRVIPRLATLAALAAALEVRITDLANWT